MSERSLFNKNIPSNLANVYALKVELCPWEERGCCRPWGKPHAEGRRPSYIKEKIQNIIDGNIVGVA